MKSDFSLEQEFGWAKEIRFPLKFTCGYAKGVQSIFKQFDNAVLCSSILSKEEKREVKNFTYTLLKVYRHQVQGDYCSAFELFDRVASPLKSRLPFAYVGYKDNFCNIRTPYYRIVDSSRRKYNYTQMLHVPFKCRENISTNRYSAPGIPCAYMSTMKTPAWYECGLPDQFQIATYKVKPECHQKLLRLDIRPLEVFHTSRLLSANNSTDSMIELIKTYYYVFPLLTACSVTRENRSGKFADEYVIPQILMMWIVKDDDFIGIRYHSNVVYEKPMNFNSYNVAIPARRPFDSNGYSKLLKDIFDVTAKKHPKVQRVDFQVAFGKNYNAQLRVVSSFQKVLKDTIRNKNFPPLLMDYYTVCGLIESNADALKVSHGIEKYPHIATLTSLIKWGENLLRNNGQVDTSFDALPLGDEETQNAMRLENRFEQDIIPILQDLQSLDYKMWEWENE